MKLPEKIELKTRYIHDIVGGFSSVGHGLELELRRANLFWTLMDFGKYAYVCVSEFLYPKLSRPELPYLIFQKTGYDYLMLVAIEDDIDKDVLAELKWSMVAWEEGTKQDYAWINPSAVYGMEGFSFTEMLITRQIKQGLKFLRVAPIANAIADEELELIADVSDLDDLPVCEKVELYLVKDEEFSRIQESVYDDGYNDAFYVL